MQEAQNNEGHETTYNLKNDVPLGQVEHIILQPSGRSDKFSLNLCKFLKKHGSHYWEICFSPRNCINGAFDVEYSADRTLASNLYVGFLDEDDGSFMGARLSEIICNGTETKIWSHPPCEEFVPVPDFWGRYYNFGKCAIDPEHKLYSARDRYTVLGDGTTRVCDWCGRVEELHIKRTVIDENLKKKKIKMKPCLNQECKHYDRDYTLHCAAEDEDDKPYLCLCDEYISEEMSIFRYAGKVWMPAYGNRTDR